jgi:hypothetical protein
MMMSWKAGIPLKDAPGQVYPLDIIDVVGLAGPVYLDYYNNAAGLPLTEKRKFLSALRMTSAEAGCHEPKFYIDLLSAYGPLWLTTDGIPGDPRLAPHARVLTRITGTSATANDIYFHFNDPAKPDAEQHIPYLQFQKEYEEAVKDSKSVMLYDQIFHFFDKETWKKRVDWAKEGAEIEEAIEADKAAAIKAAEAAGEKPPVDAGPTEGYKIGGPWQIRHTVPVHETMVLSALLAAKADLPDDARVPWDGFGGPVKGTENTDKSVNEFFRGVTWNDDPACMLFTDNAYTYRLDNFVHNTGAGWLFKFQEGEYFPEDKTNITGRSHFGDLQFVHAMASVNNEDPEETLAKIMLWAEFTYNVAINNKVLASVKLGDIPYQTESSQKYTTKVPVTFTLSDFFKNNTDPTPSMTVSGLFRRFSLYQGYMIDRRALGSLLHLIQDSFAKGHTKRELLNPKDLKDEGKLEFAPKTWGKLGSVITFHTFKGQGSEHGKWDYLRTTGMDPRNIDSFNRAWGARDAIAHSIEIVKFWMNKTPWDAKDGPKDYLLKNVFALHKNVTLADGLVN